MDEAMTIRCDTQSAASVAAEALISYVFEPEGEAGKSVEGVIEELDRAAGGALKRLADAGELTGKKFETTLLHFLPGLAAQRVLLVGAGKKDKFGNAELRKVAAVAARFLKARSLKKAAFLAREGYRDAASAQAVTEGLLLGNFDGDKYRTDKKNGPLESASLLGFDASAQAGVDRGRIIAESQNFARELGNEPSNLLTPTLLAERAVAMARGRTRNIEVLDEKRICGTRAMGALPLGVVRGSAAEPPRLDRADLYPGEARSRRAGARTGGQSDHLRYRRNLHQASHRYGKDEIRHGGRSSHVGCDESARPIEAASSRTSPSFRPPRICPGARLKKPGDVQIAMSGKSIEVINTDAEGRLILADGIAYAKQLGATHLVDAATLTGAIVVALGAVNSGVFGTNEKPSPNACWQAPERRAKRCGSCLSTTSIATKLRAPSPTFKMSAAAAPALQRRRGSCVNSPAILRGCISTSPDRRGSTTPNPGAEKAVPESACGPWWNWP